MENKSMNLWDELARLCLIQARKAVETEENKIPNVACVEVAERLVGIVVSIEKMKHDFAYQKQPTKSGGTANQGVMKPGQSGYNINELAEKLKNVFAAGEQFKAPLSFVLEQLKGYGGTKNTP